MDHRDGGGRNLDVPKYAAAPGLRSSNGTCARFTEPSQRSTAPTWRTPGADSGMTAQRSPTGGRNPGVREPARATRAEPPAEQRSAARTTRQRGWDMIMIGRLLQGWLPWGAYIVHSTLPRKRENKALPLHAGVSAPDRLLVGHGHTDANKVNPDRLFSSEGDAGREGPRVRTVQE